LVVGYSGEAPSDVYCLTDLVATRRASKHLEYVRTSESIAKAMQTQPAPGVTPLHVDSQRAILDRVRDNLDQAPSWIACGTTWIRRPALAVASWTLTDSFDLR
jgi:hypothetical protein